MQHIENFKKFKLVDKHTVLLTSKNATKAQFLAVVLHDEDSTTEQRKNDVELEKAFIDDTYTAMFCMN